MNLKLIRSGFAAAAIFAAPIAAQAADLPAPSYKAPAYVSPSVFSWSGFYVGLNGGYAFGNSHWDSPLVDLSVRGALFGVTAGYNFQTGSWVWGIEGDLDYSAAKGSAACGFGGTCETRNTWLGTLRGRVGYGGWSNFMPYITGGAAFGGVKATDDFGSTSATRIGWTIGAGLEYALFSSWSIKAEYLYADLGKFNCTACDPTVTTDNVTYHTSIVRVGVNYRF